MEATQTLANQAGKLTELYSKLGERRSRLHNTIISGEEMQLLYDDIREFTKEISSIEKEFNIKLESLIVAEPEYSLYDREVKGLMYNYDSCLS